MTNKYLFLLLVVATSFSGCCTFYQSAPSITPILREKGDGNIFLSLKDAQVAYAVTEHLGIVGSVHFDNKLQSFFSDTAGIISTLLKNNLENIKSKGFKSYQIGAVYFQKLDHTKSVQAGFTAGSYAPAMMITVNRGLFKKNTDEDLAYKCMKTDLYLNFVHSSKYVDFITSVKLTGIKYNSAVYSEPLVMKELGKMTANEYPTIGTRYFFLEPSATIQYGFDQFKFRMQGFLSQPLKENAFAKSQVGVSLGLNYQFNLASKTKQRAKHRA